MSRIIVSYNFLTKISSPKKKSYFYIYNNYLIKIIVVKRVKIPFTVIPYLLYRYINRQLQNYYI